MSWEIALSLTGTGLALLTTFTNIWWNYYSKHVDYTIEYKKYIVEKRKKSYETVENFLAHISVKLIHPSSGQPIHRFFLSTYRPTTSPSGVVNPNVANENPL